MHLWLYNARVRAAGRKVKTWKPCYTCFPYSYDVYLFASECLLLRQLHVCVPFVTIHNTSVYRKDI